MKTVVVLLAALFTFAGCKSKQVEPAKLDVAQAKAPEQRGEQKHDDEDDLQPVVKAPPRQKLQRTELRELTETQLEKFITYQTTAESLGGDLEKGVQGELSKVPKAGGREQLEKTRAVWAEAANQHAANEQKAAEASGLSTNDANWIRPMVKDVIETRRTAQSGSLEKSLETARAQLSRMNPEQRAEAEEDVKALEEKIEKVKKLEDQRQLYGDHNVELILKYEPRLLPLYPAAPK